MWLKTIAVTLPIASLSAGLALAEGPTPHADLIAGKEIMEIGSFSCTADGKT